MTSGRAIFLFLASQILAAPVLLASAATELRYMSLTIRDRPPTVAEAQAVAAGTTTLDTLITTWLATPEHQERIRRYFNDQFGAGPDSDLVEDSFFLLEESGILYLRDKGACDAASATTITDAWWLGSGESVQVCNNTRSDALTNGTVECTDSGVSGIGSDGCGCGPNMILCYPESLRTTFAEHLRYEFQHRGLYAYEENLSWTELLGGDFFYGSRILYKHYLDQQAIYRNILPTATDLTNLTGLPLTTYARTDFPESGDVSRAGLATSPVFLRQYNNFRSRINILTARLLCQDVDASLNTDGIARFVNETLSDFDQVHGTNPDCSGCHYPMDNMGSTIHLWNEGGWFEFYGTPGTQNLSGHAFGASGTGPGFLMTAYVNRGTPFHTCMARTAWEDFSGATWEDLGASVQNSLIAASGGGPRSLIRAILTSTQIRSLHNNGISQTTIGGVSSYDFTNDINPILQTNCSGAACHSAGTSLGAQYEFIDNESVFSQVPAGRIDDDTMPPPSSNRTISDGDRSILRSWRDQQ